MTKPVLIVHPNDHTTRFLNRVKNHLTSNFPERIHHFNIHFSDTSHTDCLNRIQSHKENGVVIFLGHGRSDSLYGSKAPNYGNEFISSDAILEFPEKYYGKEVFINAQNISVFRGNLVFCLACNSNKLVNITLDGGAKAFIGFGDIPTSLEELRDSKNSLNNFSLDRITRVFKTEINYIVKKSLESSFNSNYTFQQLYELLVFITNQRIANLLVNRKDLKERKVIVDLLYNFKMDMICVGDKDIKMNIL